MLHSGDPPMISKSPRAALRISSASSPARPSAVPSPSRRSRTVRAVTRRDASSATAAGTAALASSFSRSLKNRSLYGQRR
ncbi:hypothetical protein ACFQHO_05745 [Actinomadura yumaensis]|uniref:hypothetical protein n=1 Tax=Actinomadura yumaensis TaxID=111807 RepID=UPI00360FCCF1